MELCITPNRRCADCRRTIETTYTIALAQHAVLVLCIGCLRSLRGVISEDALIRIHAKEQGR